MRNFFAILFFGSLIIFPFYAESTHSDWGAKAADLNSSPDLADMLRYAIEDEYLARAEYAAIMKEFGSQRPFSNIMKAEETHIGWLRDVYARLQMTIPEDRAKDYVVLPKSLEDAYRAGVQAEIDNIAMYDHFLSTDIIRKPENDFVADVFVRLRDASKNHLSAFRNALNRNK